jgi:hypothetical protein
MTAPRTIAIAALALAALCARAATAQDPALFSKDEKAARAAIAGKAFLCKTVHGRMPDGRPVAGRLELRVDREGKQVDVALRAVGAASWQNLKLEWKPSYTDPRPASPRDPSAGARHANAFLVETREKTKNGSHDAEILFRFVWTGPLAGAVALSHPTLGELSGNIALEQQEDK